MTDSPNQSTGALIGRRITPTGLPQTVAALHSVVGLAAVLTSIGSVVADISHVSTLHMVTAYLGVLIGTYIPREQEISNCSRWCYLYWFYCGFPEARRTYVFETYDTTW